MSPRAACRLDHLGFERVLDYVGGKADWRAAGEPTEGPEASTPRAGAVADRDVITCDPTTGSSELHGRLVDDRPAVVTQRGVVLGVVRAEDLQDLDDGRDVPIGELMHEGPATLRADLPVEQLGERLTKLGVESALVTTPEGELLGVVTRSHARADGSSEFG